MENPPLTRPISHEKMARKDEIYNYFILLIEEYSKILETDLDNVKDKYPFNKSNILIQCGITKSNVYYFLSKNIRSKKNIIIYDYDEKPELNNLLDLFEPNYEMVSKILGIRRIYAHKCKENISGQFSEKQAKDVALEIIKMFFKKIILGEDIKDYNMSLYMKNKIFVAHGHDLGMLDSVTLTLKKLELEPIILKNKASRSKTIIEKVEKHSDVVFAIVLLSPDDKGCEIKDFPKKVKYRARQNTILELGYLAGKLKRENVIVLNKLTENFDIPSDYSGVLFIPFDEKEMWKTELVKELKDAGFNVDANKLIE